MKKTSFILCILSPFVLFVASLVSGQLYGVGLVACIPNIKLVAAALFLELLLVVYYTVLSVVVTRGPKTKALRNLLAVLGFLFLLWSVQEMFPLFSHSWIAPVFSSGVQFIGAARCCAISVFYFTLLALSYWGKSKKDV